MKLHQNTSPVKISGAVTAPSQFNIAASKEAFKILSSGLYTNKIRAIIRELSCNAYDAHVAAGKGDVAFDMHLPTSFEPFFSIKDYGTGLEFIKGGCKKCKGSGSIQITVGEDVVTEDCATCNGSGDYDAVKELYCQYFATNKSDSNLFVGALGLGSKSPFCYTEGFSVTNVYDEMARVYSCFINERGMPAVLIQNEEPASDVQNGVEVSFPVRQQDVWEFENQAKYALEFFDPRPSINTEIQIKETAYSFRNKKWGMRTDGGKPRAIQGMVQYSIGEIDKSRLTYDQTKLCEMPIDLFFEIGSLEVAASRESLSNDERTVQNILNHLDNVKDSLLEDAKQKLAACKTLWDARVMVFSMSNDKTFGSLLSVAVAKGLLTEINPEFNTKSEKPTIDPHKYPDVEVVEFVRSSRKKAFREVLNNQYSAEIPFGLSDTAVFLVDDVGPAANKYVNWLVQHNQKEVRKAYLITGVNKKKTDEHEVTPKETVLEQAAAIIAALGQPPVKMLSEVRDEYIASKPEGERVLRRPVRKTLYFRGDRIKGRLGWVSAWYTAKPDSILDEGTKYYVELEKLVPTCDHFFNAENLNSFVKVLKTSGAFSFGKDSVLYGIPKRYTSRLDDTWVELTSSVLDELRKLLPPWKDKHIAACRREFTTGIDGILKKMVKKNLVNRESQLATFVSCWTDVEQTKMLFAKLDPVVSFAQTMGFRKLKLQENSVDELKKHWELVKQQYPLMKFVTTSYEQGAAAKALAQYINMVDNETSTNNTVLIYLTQQGSQEHDGDALSSHGGRS